MDKYEVPAYTYISDHHFTLVSHVHCPKIVPTKFRGSLSISEHLVIADIHTMNLPRL